MVASCERGLSQSCLGEAQHNDTSSCHKRNQFAQRSAACLNLLHNLVKHETRQQRHADVNVMNREARRETNERLYLGLLTYVCGVC
jgi:hypothetical protein